MSKFLFSALVLFVMTQMHSQQKTISGIVSDSSGPLPGVSVIIKGTTIGTETDFNGAYSIKTNLGDVLQFSFIGLVTVEKTVGVLDKMDITMVANAESLQEVVVTGFGRKVKKRSSSYTVSKSISGKVSGVHVTSSSGSVGSSTRVVLRGASSISGKVDGDLILASESEYNQIPQSGQLTAGEINDLKKWDEWLDILKSNEYRDIQNDWSFYLEKRIEIMIKSRSGNPVNNAKVVLYDNQGKVIMTSLTDFNGQVTMFKDLNKKSKNKYYTVKVFQDKKVYGRKITRNNQKVNFVLDDKKTNDDIDIMFTIDATGSMGDEMNYLKSELKNIITRLDKSIDKKRVALTFYRDHGDEYVVKDFDFNSDIDKVKNNLEIQNAEGGGDYEEAVEEALKISMSQSWNKNAKSKLMFLLLDAPPHLKDENVSIIKEQIKKAQSLGIKIIPIVASDANKEVEFLMRFFSVSTNGTYVFLTDDSGIGNHHIKPTTDKYKVEKLNDLIVRLIEENAGV